jgi:hypothetical protein
MLNAILYNDAMLNVMVPFLSLQYKQKERLRNIHNTPLLESKEHKKEK